MRLLQSFRVLFLLLLSVSVYCGELPESWILSDDGANDFVEGSALPTLGKVSAIQTNNERPLSALSPKVYESSQFEPETRPISVSGPDLLRLLSIQRK